MNNIDDLRSQVTGPVFLREDEGYDEERGGFQTAYRHRPAVIVGASGSGDVRAAVGWAGSRGLPVAVQATGHGLSAAATDGMLISTRRMTAVRVDPQARTAWFEAGVRVEKVIEAATPHGLAPLNGSAPQVGAVAYTLGGGLGLLARQYGYATDHVRGIDVVTADGRLRHVTADSDPDLFWALRGGRDNFGVVTSMEVDLVPVARVYGGSLFFDGAQVEDVLRTYESWTTTVPEEMTSSVAMMAFPGIPQIPEPLRGRYVAMIRIIYTGAAAEGERLVAPLRDLGPRLVDTLEDMPYAKSASIYNDPTDPHGYLGNNALLRELDPKAVRAVLDRTGPDAPVPYVVEVRHLGGALAGQPAVPNAIGHREANYLVRAVAIVGDLDVADVRARLESVFEALEPWTIGRFLNFFYGEVTADELRQAYDADAYRRLAEVKAAYDPANTFRLNHNIRPAR